MAEDSSVTYWGLLNATICVAGLRRCPFCPPGGRGGMTEQQYLRILTSINRRQHASLALQFAAIGLVIASGVAFVREVAHVGVGLFVLAFGLHLAADKWRRRLWREFCVAQKDAASTRTLGVPWAQRNTGFAWNPKAVAVSGSRARSAAVRGPRRQRTTAAGRRA